MEFIELIYVPFQFVSGKHNNLVLINHTCHLSKTVLNSPNLTNLFGKYHDICFRQRQPACSVNSKPWTCQVDVDVLPQQFQLAFMKSPKTFYFSKLPILDGLWWPPEGPSFRMLVGHNFRYNANDITNWYKGAAGDHSATGDFFTAPIFT